MSATLRQRRRLLQAIALRLLPAAWLSSLAPTRVAAAASQAASRVRPGDAAWPSPAQWEQLADALGDVSESNYFEPEWQRAFWGANYPRLLAVKEKYDPDGLFFVHHGVGSERWSTDGFARRA